MMIAFSLSGVPDEVYFMDGLENNTVGTSGNDFKTQGVLDTAVGNEKTQGVLNADTPKNDASSDASFSDSAEGKKTDDNASEKPVQEGKSAHKADGKSAEHAARRREQEAKRREIEHAAQLKKARVDAILEVTGGINTYTGKEMKDGTDVEVFLQMREIEKNGGDPVADYAEYSTKLRRQKEQEAARAKERTEKLSGELAEFQTVYPDVNIEELINNAAFNDYADGKVGRLSLKAIYEGFISISAAFEKLANERAAQRLANANASPGALSTTGESGDKIFSLTEVKAMSSEERIKNYDLIMKSKKYWK